MLPLLAEFTPLSPSAQLAIFSLLTVVVTLVSLWSMLRRRPPLDAQIARFEAAIEGLNRSVADLAEAQRQASSHGFRIDAIERNCAACRIETNRALKDVYDRIESVESSMGENFQSVERALGRIEGQIAGKV